MPHPSLEAGDPIVAAAAARLGACTTWSELYAVLSSIPDEVLLPAGTLIEDSTPGLLAVNAAGNRFLRLAGFLIWELEDPGSPALTAVLEHLVVAVDTAEDEARTALAVRASLEAATMADALPERARFAAVALSLTVYSQTALAAVSTAFEALTTEPFQEAGRRQGVLTMRASHLRLRYETTGDGEDLDEAIRLGERALAEMADDDPARTALLDNQANRLVGRFQRSGQAADLDAAVDLGAEAVAGTPATSPHRAPRLDNHCLALLLRFDAADDQRDLTQAMGLSREAVELLTPDHPARANILDRHAALLSRRYAVEGDRGDLARAIEHGAQALASLPAAHSRRRVLLANQATRLLEAHDDGSDPEQITQVLALVAEAIALCPQGVAELPAILSLRAEALLVRHRREPTRADLAAAIGALEDAVELTSDDHHLAPQLTTRLAQALWLESLVEHGVEAPPNVVALHRRWLEAVARGIGTRASILEGAGWWMSWAFDAVSEGAFDWGHVARAGRIVLTRARQLSVLSDREPASEIERLSHSVDAQTAVDGVLGLCVVACVRAGDLPRAVEALELGTAAIVSEHVARTPAQQTATAVPMPSAGSEPFGVADLAARLTAPVVWLLASRASGVGIRLSPDGSLVAHQIEGLTRDATMAWHDRLRQPQIAPTDGDGPEPGSVAGRGPAAGPEPSEVAAVLREVSTQIGPVLAWLSEPGACLVPLGRLAGIPWQVHHEELRLHISAGLSTRPAGASSSDRLVVVADAHGDLPGARAEAAALQAVHGALVLTGGGARLDTLASLPSVRCLHLGLHGTPDPAIWFADRPLTVASTSEIRHLLSDLDHLVLNCCTSGASVEGVYDQTLSIAALALAHHAGHALIALWPIDDAVAATFAVEYHRALADGLAPRAAMTQARHQTGVVHPGSATPAAYQLIG